MLRNVVLGAACVGLFSMTLVADTLKLKDGTSVQGRVIDQGEKYWVKEADGTSKLVDKDQVQTWTKGDADATPTPAAAGTGGGGGGGASIPAGAGFTQVKAKADRSDSAIAAVGMWQAYVDSKPSAADLKAARAEVAQWQKVVDGHGEKLKGKWVYGAERDALLEKVRALKLEASKAAEGNQLLVGLHKYEEAVALYPNDFEGQFFVGWINLRQGAETGKNSPKIDAAIKAFEQASRIDPESAAAWSDLAVAHHFKGHWQQAIDMAYKAVKLEDSKGTVTNLVNVIYYAPAGVQRSSKVKTIMEETSLLAGKYGINGGGNYEFVEPSERGGGMKDSTDEGKEDGGMAGVMGNGSGEFISADGYVLTNRHVAKEGDYLVVRMSDGVMRTAKRVVIDDEQDMAVIKVNTGGSDVPFIRLAQYDHPAVGADVAVFGFPLFGTIGSMHSSVKMTRGIITAWDEDQALCDVTVDAQVNPGNSGGCMVDKYGNLLALTTAKTFAAETPGEAAISSYGEGQSTGRLRKFFAKQKEKLAGLKLAPADASSVLSNEELAKRLTPVTVCILICKGTPPTTETVTFGKPTK